MIFICSLIFWFEWIFARSRNILPHLILDRLLDLLVNKWLWCSIKSAFWLVAPSVHWNSRYFSMVWTVFTSLETSVVETACYRSSRPGKCCLEFIWRNHDSYLKSKSMHKSGNFDMTKMQCWRKRWQKCRQNVYRHSDVKFLQPIKVCTFDFLLIC